MKTWYLLLCAFIFFAVRADAQLLPPTQPEQDACNALRLCGNNFSTPYGYQGNGTVLDLSNTPCSGGEANAVWFRLEVNTGGVIVFTIAPFTNTDDYDFAVLDITNGNCNSLSIANVIRCNFNNNSPVFNNGVLGLNTTSTTLYTPAGATGGSYLQQISANAGDVYLIMINNFGSPDPNGGYFPSAGFTLDFTGTTATFNGPSPNMLSLIPSCNGAQQVTLVMSENILCNSIEPGGSDFTITGGAGGSLASAVGVNCTGNAGYTDTILLTFAAPLPAGNYNLVAQTGTDGNTLLNTCSHPLLLPASIPFTVPNYARPAFVAIDTPACSELKIKMTTNIRCSGIAPDGSDFTISGPQSNSIIAAYGTGCDTANFTDSVVLLLQNPIHTDGVYTITAQAGTDGNTQMDSCGIPQYVGDAISFTINSYDGRLLTISDTVLCEAGYLTLSTQNNSVAPPVKMNCDTAAVVCSGNTRMGFVGGKDSSTIGNTPFYGAADDQRAQYLFLASELKRTGLKAGIIQKLELLVSQISSTQPYKNMTIKVGCTPLGNLGSTFLTGPQVVYSNPSYVVVPGWNAFSFTTPYNWDGTSNLLVEICYDNNFSTASDAVVHSVTPFLSVIRRFANGMSGCALNTQGTASSSTRLRPKMRFSICEPVAGPASYVWSPGLLLSDSTIQNPLVYIQDDKSYHVTAFDKFGCAHRDSLVVTMSKRSPGLSPLDTSICLGGELTLKANGGVNYRWISGDASSMSCTDCPNPLVHPLQSQVYTVSVSDQYECADTLSASIQVYDLPVIAIWPQDTIIKYGTKLQLSSSGGNLYTWMPASAVSDPGIVNPVFIGTTPITLYLYGIDAKGCRNVDSLHVGIDYKDATFIPTGFSPNGDGLNDFFRVGSVSFQKLEEFRVFNRWGQEVFSTTDPSRGWDGTFKGVPQDVGTYNYIIRLAFPDGVTETYKGTVTLIR